MLRYAFLFFVLSPALAQSGFDEYRILPEVRTIHLTFGIDLAFLDDELLVGMSGDSREVVYEGSIEVYHEVGGDWVAKQTIRPSTRYPEGFFGRSFELAGDHLIARAPDSLYVFHKQEGAWEETQVLPFPGEREENYGWDLMATDYHVFAHVADLGSEASHQSGVVVYRRDGAEWEYEQLVVSPEESGPQFGGDLCAIGDHLFIAAPQVNFGSYRGVIYVYEYNGSQWSQVQRIQSSASSNFWIQGGGLACTDTELLVAAKGGGALWRFEHDGAQWSSTSTISLPSQRFGHSLHYANQTLFVGGSIFVRRPNGRLHQKPVQVVYRRANGGWKISTFLQNNFPQEFEEGTFGQSLALGKTKIAVAAPFSSHGASKVGEVVVFSDPATSTQTESVPLNTSHQGISVFPNPAGSFATLEVASESPQELTVEAFDLLGRNLPVEFYSVSPNRWTIDTSMVPLGVLNIRVCSAGGACSSKRLIKADHSP